MGKEAKRHLLEIATKLPLLGNGSYRKTGYSCYREYGITIPRHRAIVQ